MILPRLREFKPDILLISAGFDAHTRDPLANLNLVEADFAWVTQKLMEIADNSAQGRIVSMLEGGYDLQGLARSAAAHVTALMRGSFLEWSCVWTQNRFPLLLAALLPAVSPPSIGRSAPVMKAASSDKR